MNWNRFSLRLATGKPIALWPTNAMPSKDLKERRRDGDIPELHSRDSEAALDLDAEFAGTEARKKLEKGLLLKLDARMFILVVIYILNFVSRTLQMGFRRVSRC